MSTTLYTRQKQMKVNRDVKVCVVGCGGVGFNVAMLLAMSGVKELVLFDNDKLEEHNLNRLPVPMKCVGMNKAKVAKEMIKQMRPNIDVTCFKTKFDEMHIDAVDWIVDCTDSYSTQKAISSFAEESGIKYCKSGYDGERMSIHDKVAMWDLDEADDEGYVITPSWSVPSMVVASLTVAKILKYNDKELGVELKHLFLK